MTSGYLIDGTIFHACSSSAGSVAFSGGKILEAGDLDPASYPGFEVIDARGKYLLPGGFDPHVHLALPTPAGPSCDDFRSGSRAALEGGTTFFMDFVTPRRRQSLQEALHLRRAEAAESLTGCGLHMGISEWNRSVEAEILPLIEKEGIRSFKAYLAYRETIGISLSELEALMRIVASGGGLVMVHCEDGTMISDLQRRLLAEGKSRPCYHARSRPPEAEMHAISQVLELSAKTGCPVYIVHISTGRGADLVAEAKRSGVRVFAETCPHYLLFDDRVYDPSLHDRQVLPFILSPPIRSRDDQEQLWERIADGTFDVVATDHCPFRLHGQKDRWLHDFTRIPNGAGGMKHRLPGLYSSGVATGRITPERFVSLISTRPAEIFGMGHRKGKLEAGYDADLVILDPAGSQRVSAPGADPVCDADIYEGMVFRGRIEAVFHGGEKYTT